MSSTRRPACARVAAAVLPGRHTQAALEHGAHVFLVVESRLLCDDTQRQIRFSEQLLRFTQLNADDLWKRKERALRDQMMELPEWIPAAERRKWRKTTTSRLLGDLPPVVETLVEFFDTRLACDIRLGRTSAPHEGIRLITIEGLGALAGAPP